MQVQNKIKNNDILNSSIKQNNDLSNQFKKDRTSIELNSKVDLNDESQITKDSTSKYLKVLSRIENLVKNDSLPETALESFIKALEKKFEELSDNQKNTIFNLPESKQINITNLETLKEKIKVNLKSKEKSTEILNLLKKTEFVELMINENDVKENITYTETVKNIPKVGKDPKIDKT